ncbi:cytochrome P450, partial [Micromonospora sp. AMSO12t]|uniref:cytochrome P450 n=1 Tax=Micromonospora sp. AMSO12t TaxID=2650410 RepID=UPI001CED2CAA
MQNDVVRVWPKAWKLRIDTLKNADIDLLPEWAHREACGGNRSPGSRSAIPFVAMAFEEAVMRLDPFAGAYLTDPAQVWRRLLDEPEGVRHDPDLGLWLITRHADVRRALGDAEAFGNALTLAPIYDVCPEAMEFIARIDAPP